MAARLPMFTYECPFLTGEEGVTCTTPITEQQYHTYCREISNTEKEPNYNQCNAYENLLNSPIMTMKRLYAKNMDMAHKQSRKHIPDKV